MTTNERTIVGVMTGTSMDAIDAALVRLSGHGLSMRARVLHTASRPLGDVRESLRNLASGKRVSAQSICEVEHAFSGAIAELIGDAFGSEALGAVALHGQTIYHDPPHTWQLINPWIIASRVRCPVVFDFRRGDLSVGGQGAPLTPIADLVLYGTRNRSRAIVNLGGFCNITHLPRVDDPEKALHGVRGRDVCPCNHWLDRACAHYFRAPFDGDGKLGQKGTVDAALRDALVLRWSPSGTQARSLGSAHEAFEPPDGIEAHDVLATLADAIAVLIAQSSTRADEIILAGGSVRNASLVERIRALAQMPVRLSDEVGIDAEARESAAMAVLGALCMDGVPIGLPSVTGAERPIVSGSWCFPDGFHRMIHDQPTA